MFCSVHIISWYLFMCMASTVVLVDYLPKKNQVEILCTEKVTPNEKNPKILEETKSTIKGDCRISTKVLRRLGLG